eukprot:g32835.t1
MLQRGSCVAIKLAFRPKESFSTLCWVSFLILFVIYAYSCLFRILVDCSRDYSEWENCSMLFGTMPKAMFTLFQMLTLESWRD